MQGATQQQEEAKRGCWEDFKAFPPTLSLANASTLKPRWPRQHKCIWINRQQCNCCCLIVLPPGVILPCFSWSHRAKAAAKSRLTSGPRFMSCLLFPARADLRRGSWVNTSQNVWRQQFTDTLFSLTQRLMAGGIWEFVKETKIF